MFKEYSGYTGLKDVIKINFTYFFVLCTVVARKLKISHVALFICVGSATLECSCEEYGTWR